MYEAHGRYGKYPKNVIKSYTSQGCFPEGLREWILAPFFIDFGRILEGLGAPKVAKQPSEHPLEKCEQKQSREDILVSLSSRGSGLLKD